MKSNGFITVFNDLTVTFRSHLKYFSLVLNIPVTVKLCGADNLGNIWFPLDLADETTTIKINCKRQYSFVEQVVDENAIIDVPENYRQLLISGVLYNLTARPKYRDENLFAVNKQTFESEFQSLKFSYHNLESTYESRDTTYKY